MNDKPFMPKATAVWLVENTKISFKQIADFCNLHELEVKGIADGDVAKGIKAYNPILAGQLTREEVEACSADHNKSIILNKKKLDIKSEKREKNYIPLSRRQDRPNAALWLIKNYPELRDSQISKLVGTTKPTINAIRDRSHWNSANIAPQNPVGLGLCSGDELEKAIEIAKTRLGKSQAPGASTAPDGILGNPSAVASSLSKSKNNE